MIASDLHATVRMLADIAAIRALRQLYTDAADAKYAPDAPEMADPVRLRQGAARQAGCFTADAEWDGGPFGGSIVGVEALLAFFLRSPWRFTAHSYQDAGIEVDGDRATGQWRLWELGVSAQDGRVVLLVGRTAETYARLPDLGWRIASMRFNCLHSVELGADPTALRRLLPV